MKRCSRPLKISLHPMRALKFKSSPVTLTLREAFIRGFLVSSLESKGRHEKTPYEGLSQSQQYRTGLEFQEYYGL